MKLYALPHPEIWFGTDGPDKKTGTSNADFLVGAAGNDTLIGLGGADQLNGQMGADVMDGGGGRDRIYISGGDVATGGTGADTFVFLDPKQYVGITDHGRAVITDFAATGTAHDVIEIMSFDVGFGRRDAGLDDGFEMIKKGSDVLIRLVADDGGIERILLKNVRMMDMDASDFVF